jgi:D-arabinose 5-phosphate isomerase GutQ
MSTDVDRVLSAARDLVAAERAALEAVEQSLDESFLTVVALIRAATGRVLTIGVGTSGPVARRMAHLLSTTGTPAFFLHPGDALHGALGAVRSDDVVVAISKGGRSAELNHFAELARRRGAALVVLTGAPSSPLGRLADATVCLPPVGAADPGGVIAMGSSLVAAVWGDALALVLMQMSSYSWAQVLETHPSGAVGQHQELPQDLPRLPPVGLDISISQRHQGGDR